MSLAPTVGDSTLRAFVPDVAFSGTDGDCRRIPRPSKRTVTYAATFPQQDGSQSTVTIALDSAGRLVRYSEVRGTTRIPGFAPGASEAQRESVLVSAEAANRRTTISLDYPMDEAMLANRGGGLPNHAALGTVGAAETLASLGPIMTRVKLVKRLCGLEQ